jgi:hypothetical protein
MIGRNWTLVAAFTMAALAACSDSKSGPSSTQPAPYVGITASVSSVIANGTSTVTLSYTNTGGGSATITTNGGTFPGAGGSSVTTSQASGTVTLLSCVYGAGGCPASATVTITATSGTASATVAFVSRDAACLSNCSADATCTGAACTRTGGTGVCAAGTCTAGAACTASPAGSTSEVSCTDGVDNDCNGSIDCADTTCDGQQCKAGSPSFVCKNKACTDVASGLAVTVTPARTRLPAIANVATDVLVTVTSEADPAPNLTISVALSDNSLGAITPASARTDASGNAHFTFTATGATGTEKITAAIAAIPTVSASANVTIPRLASLRLLTGTDSSVQFAVMGAKGSGWQDLGWLKVQALDDLGLAYPDGLPVRFEHRRLGGSTLGTPLTADTATCLAAQQCVGYQGVTASTVGAADSTGVAQGWVYSGTVAGTLQLTASATAAGASFGVQLPDITVVGAKASGTNFSVVCSPRNLPALAETDCAISLVDAPFTCEAVLKDRFNNVLGRQTQVIFVSEASAVGQVVDTPQYTGEPVAGLGLAVQTFQTLGNGLPFDVDPNTTINEPFVVHGRDGCGTRTHNPRDGVVTILAVADGEEAFFDANGNGTFDAGEPFVDLGEPFVDQDDDGIWTPGEWFLDLDGNGSWTGPNGTWDANTKIWTQTFVLYTAAASANLPVGGGFFLGTRVANASSFVDACTATTTAQPFDVFYETTIQPATSKSYAVVASDGNLNFLTMKATYGVSLVPSTADFKTTYGGLAGYADLTGLAWRYWPCANGGAGACASQCRATGAGSPCRMKPEFTDFSCGLSTWMMVTGGSKASSGTLNFDVTVPWERYGTGVVDHVSVGVGGSSRAGP